MKKSHQVTVLWGFFFCIEPRGAGERWVWEKRTLLCISKNNVVDYVIWHSSWGRLCDFFSSFFYPLVLTVCVIDSKYMNVFFCYYFYTKVHCHEMVDPLFFKTKYERLRGSS